MDESAIAVDIQNLTKQFSNKPNSPLALNDISLQVPVGKICCILGPNGSGKTTLLKILAGLILPTSGSISIMGVDIAKDPIAGRASIGWMPAEERSGFYGRLSGRQNLDFFAALNGLDSKIVDRVVGNLALQIGIGEEMDQMILKTSAGAKQKLAVARALLHNPAVLLFDEPARGLDPHTILRFRRLIRDHMARIQKKTVILSTHLLEEARKTADIIIVLQDGRIIKRLEGQEMEKEFRDNTIEEFYMKTIGNGGKA